MALRESERKGIRIIMTINKDLLVKAVAQETEGTQKDARKHIDAFETVVKGALAEGEDVKIKGFVDFTSKQVEARTARNPQTGESVEVPAHRKATATLSKTLRKF